MSRRYFEEEMRYLQEAAKVFAEAHPEQAQYLDVDHVSDRDPYVERLFEGFAFLSGRVHERLDNEMPEYTERLLQLLFPHYRKPVPALSIVEFAPEPGVVQDTTVLEQGTEVRSEPVGEEDLGCRFTTTQDVRLRPLRLEEAHLRYADDNTSSAQLRFGFDRGTDVEQLDLDSLRLHFHGDTSTASTLHQYFTRRTSYLKISTREDERSTALRGNRWVTPAGLSPDEDLFPTESSSLTGFRLLQEYFCFRRGFWFVDVHGLDRLDFSGDTVGFDLDVCFDRSYPEERRFDEENIRLHCTPVINLFDLDAEPIRINGEVGEHRVIPSNRYPKGIQTYDVQSVVGIEEGTGTRREYSPFFSFQHAQNGCSDDRFYATSRRMGPAGHPEVYLTISDDQLRGLADVPAETLSLGLRCTNGSLPREQIRQGMINQVASDIPDVAEPRNLTQPTLIRYPPTQDREDFFWKLISHWALNYQSIAETDSLIELLRLYEWTGTVSNQQRLAGIRTVEWTPKEMLERGAVLRGAEVTVEVEEGYFADEGDLCLFGLVMSRFFSAYATINSFVHLTVITVPSEQRYEWTSERGTRPNL